METFDASTFRVSISISLNNMGAQYNARCKRAIFILGLGLVISVTLIKLVRVSYHFAMCMLPVV